MKGFGRAFGRYLFGAAVHGVGYFIVAQLSLPNSRSTVSTFGFALTFGLLMQAFPFLRDLLGLKRHEPFPPFVQVVVSLMMLLLVSAWWYRFTVSPPSPERLFVLCAVGVPCLYYLARGIRLLWRDRTLDGDVGT